MKVFGSWAFVGLFIFAVGLWAGLNALGLLVTRFDPYPFQLLRLLISVVLVIQLSLVLMAVWRGWENEHRDVDRLAGTADRTIHDLALLHERLEVLQEDQWAELVRLQQRQIALLDRLLAERGSPGPSARQSVPDHPVDVERHDAAPPAMVSPGSRGLGADGASDVEATTEGTAARS
ncbi:MAG: DUF1003 domain-containing protein [Chloroflexi bacterium]|nr:DUF1003 domain-containing protein [Chloroflexota bacterium]